MADTATRRGPYAKGIAKRQQILSEALAAYAESDSDGPSLRAIAARVDLSERGLLHYFASREELLVSILRERDAAELETLGTDPAVEALIGVPARSAKTPGLVRLFLEMAAAGADPASVAHEFFLGRYRRLRLFMTQLLQRSATDAGAPPTEKDAAFLGRILIAAADGLQMQWVLDPSIDMQGDLQRLGQRLGVIAPASAPTNAASVPTNAASAPTNAASAPTNAADSNTRNG